MKILIVLAVITTLTTGDKRCNGVYFNDRYYHVNIIKDGVNHLSNLAYNLNEDSVYFIFEDIGKYPSRLLGHLDMNSHKATVIQGIRNATSIAINQHGNKVYVGGADGLFKINERYVPEQLPVQDSVKNVYFKDLLFFTNNRNEVFSFEDGYSTAIKELRGYGIDKLVIDNDNNAFFASNKDLFRVKLSTRALNTHERLKVNALATDIYNKAYVCTADGVYAYNKYKFVFDKLSDLKLLKGITFNKVNEPIYAVADMIVKLSLSEIACFED